LLSFDVISLQEIILMSVVMMDNLIDLPEVIHSSLLVGFGKGIPKSQ
jgi:hypothetical protein